MTQPAVDITGLAGEAKRAVEDLASALTGSRAQYARLYEASHLLAMSMHDMYQQRSAVVTDAVRAAYEAWLTADAGNFGPDA